MTSEGFGDMFEGDSADTFVDGGRAEGLACADPGARTPNGASGNIINILLIYILIYKVLKKLLTIIMNNIVYNNKWNLSMETIGM